MTNGAIETVLWPGAKAEVGTDLLLGGILAYKTGYHGPRNWMRQNHPDDYSIQLPADQLGPGDLGSAIDFTFKSAQASDFRNIAKYSQRLYKAGVEKDPRTYPMREFQGNIDLDRDVECWSYYRGHALTGGASSHLWHIHVSIWRKYINDPVAMRAILSIWRGESLATWRGEEEDMPTAQEVWENPDLPRPRDPVTGKVPVGVSPTWHPTTYIRNLYERVDTLEAGQAEIKATLAAILTAVNPPEPPAPTS